LSTTRAAGLSPKRDVAQPAGDLDPGELLAIRRVPSTSSSALRRSESMPGRDREDERVDEDVLDGEPVHAGGPLDRPRGDRELAVAVRAIAASGSSSIVPITSAALYVFASRQISSNFSSPSSKFALLMMHLPAA
jgi:hypothetical protein